MKKFIIVLIIVLVGAGALIIAKQNEAHRKQVKAAEETRRQEIQIQQARQKAIEQARKLEAEAEMARQKAIEKARKAEEAARKAAEELKAKINDLVNQAQSLLDAGNLQEAINITQNVLTQDPNNAQAKSILQIATAKIKEIAEQKAAALAAEAQEKLQEAGSALPASLPVKLPGQ